MLKTVKVVNPHSDLGYKIINEHDFDEDEHTLFGSESEGAVPAKMSVAELRAALEAKDIAIPEGAKKADLQALYDASTE